MEGLHRRGLTPTDVLAQSVAAAAPCGAMAITPAIVVGATGSAALFAFVVATAVCLMIAAAIRQFAQRMRVAGGLYSYTAKGLGPVAALVTGWSALLGYATVAMAGLLAVGFYLSDLAVVSGVPPGPASTGTGVAAVVVAGTATGLLLRRGVRLSARVTLVVECVAVVLVVVVLAVLLAVVLPGADLAAAFAWDPRPLPLAIGIVVAISAFIGFESATTLGVEARRPLVSVPKAVSRTVPLAGALYLFSTVVQSIALASAGPGALDSGMPLVGVLADLGLPALRVALDVCVAASYFGCALASSSALVRVLFSMGRDGVLPAAFGRAHPRFRTPATAVALVVPPVVVVPALLLVADPDRALGDLLTLSTFGYLGSYLAVCVATPVFLRRIGELTRPVRAVAGTAAVVVTLVLVYALVSAWSQRPATALVFLVTVALAGAVAAILARGAPQRLSGVGSYDETVRSDLARWERDR